MLRRTKIIATLGPSSNDYKTLESMVKAGMNVARLNFSHSQRKEHLKLIEILRQISKDIDSEIGILADLQGPKIRIKSFLAGKALLSSSNKFFLDTSLDELDGDEFGVGVDYAYLHRDINVNDKLLLDDGKIKLRVEEIRGTRIYTEILVGGELLNHKGINMPAASTISSR